MEVKVLSRETIQPSSPTPSHLETIQLSLFDQLSPLVYTRLLFFYPMNNQDDPRHHDQKKVIATIKSSLSESLSHFFLLAGRIVDKSIRCSDEGAIFIEASVDSNMTEVLKEPDFGVLAKFFPCSSLCTEPVEEYAQIVVQLNIFNCGGFAISICLLHKLLDATSLSYFLRSWASMNRGSFDSSSSSSSNIELSDYKTLSSLFPQTNLLPFHPRIHEFFSSNSEQKSRFQRFVFSAKALSDLKAKAKSSNVPDPTCVEVLTSLIWKSAMEVASVRSGSQSPSALRHAVNLRKRIQPPLPESSVGNLQWPVVARYSANETHVELSELVKLLRQTFAEIDDDYIQRLVGEEGTRAVAKFLWEEHMSLSEIPRFFTFTSWRHIGLNEVDFGWGRPVWIGITVDPQVMMNNVVILSDTVSGDGMEVLIVLDEEEMKLLEQNPEFLEFASLNPTITLS